MKTYAFFLTSAIALAQQVPGPPVHDPASPTPKKVEHVYLGKEAASWKLKAGPVGRWWSNPEIAQKLNLTADQLKKMDDIFQQNRLQLIDLNAALEKAEAILEPLVAADPPDDAQVLAQIDRVALARADLEKANSRMLWAIRRTLTPDQWKALQKDTLKPVPKKYESH